MAAAPKPQVPKRTASDPNAGIKMWSPKGPCHVALTSGHTFVVPDDPAGAAIPKHFRKEAIARGCIPVGMHPDDDDATNVPFSRDTKIREALQQMLNGDAADSFTPAGAPNLKMVADICGFQLARSEVTRVFESMQRETAAGDNDDNPEMIG